MVAVWFGGQQLDVDDATRIGFQYKSGVCESDGGSERSRTFNFTVPETPRNNKIFTFSEDPQYPGERQGVFGVIIDGGVWLKGNMYLTEWSSRRYSLLFIFNATPEGLDAAGMGGVFNDSMKISDTEPVQEGGTIPDFGFYEYLNGTHTPGQPVGVPVTQYPTANLGYIIDSLAANAGYTVNYASSDNAHHYGLVLPQMREYESHNVLVNAPNGFLNAVNTSVDGGGGTLAQAGLQLVQEGGFKRGWPIRYNEYLNVFKALRPVKIKIAPSTWYTYAFITGDGYDCWNGEGYPKPTRIDSGHPNLCGTEFELNIGEYFAIANATTDAHIGDRFWWWGPYHTPQGYRGAVTNAQFYTYLDNGVVGSGSLLSLSDNFPEDLTLKQCLQAFCDIIAGFYDVDEVNKVITVSDFAGLVSNASVGVDLDGMRILKVQNVRRYIDGWAQHNRVRCKSADYVTEDCKFVRDYQCGNAWLEDERDWTTIPFNEGNWTMRDVGGTYYKCAQLDDIEVGHNSEYNYKGQLTIIREAPVGVPALHLQTTTDEGYGRDFGNFTIGTTTLVVTVRMPLYKFLQIRKMVLAHWIGKTYIIREAAWDKGACQLTLLSL